MFDEFSVSKYIILKKTFTGVHPLQILESFKKVSEPILFYQLIDKKSLIYQNLYVLKVSAKITTFQVFGTN